jgi:hypothetical protein
LRAETDQDFKLSAKGYCGFNYLEWEPVQGAERYWIYRGVGEGHEESMPLTDFPISETNYKDTKNLIQGTKYCYIVKAVDKNAKEFAKSNEACAIPTCSTEIPQEECKLILQFQIGNKFYWVNGEQKGPMLTEPILRWDRTFLIIRHVVEEVGGTISWDGANQIVTILTKEGKKIEFQIGNKMYKVNGVPKQIDPYNPNVVPFIQNGRTLIPLRVTGDELNAKEINWYGDKKIAELVFIVPCPEKPKGRIDILLPENCIKGTKIEILDLKGNPIGLIINSKNGLFTTDCTLNCPGSYIVRPVNPNCKFYPETIQVDLKECCPAYKRVEFKCECEELKKGRIVVSMPKECLEGTVVHIINSQTNVEVATLSVNKDGVFDTGCTLDCPGIYIVKPENKNCKFYIPGTNMTETKIELKNCCPEYYKVEFKCECGLEKNGRIVVKMSPNCSKGTKVVIYDSIGNFVWSGVVNEEGVFDTGCTLKCPGEYKVVPMNPNLIFVPESKLVVLKECCPYVEVVEFECKEVTQFVQKVCACIVRMTTQPDANGYYQVYIKLNCKEGEPVYDLVLNFPANLLDTNLGLSILDYYNKFDHPVPPGLGCIFVVYESGTLIVHEWAAFPDKKPCCEEVGKGGRIVVKMSKECSEGTKVIVYDEAGGVAWSGGVGPDGTFDTGCTLKCPGVYKVVPVNEKCKFKPVSHVVKVDCCPTVTVVEFTCDCATSNKGRIVVSMPKECLEGTVVHIINSQTNVEVATLSVNKDGVFDTGCTLDCPGIYIVKPENKNCKFYIPGTNMSETKIELRSCCPEFYKVEFSCQCVKQFGRIQAKIPKECVRDSVLYIYDSSGKLVGSYNPNSEGLFDTGCNLTCPGTYTIKPYNPNCKFYPETQKIEVKECCPYIYSYEFKCECKGRIDIKLPLNCLPAKVEIYDSKGNLIYRLGEPDANGVFTTGCTLICPGSYLVKPYNPNCTFKPESKTITLTQCCPGYSYVEFECSCIQMGRIIVNITGNCPADTTVEIYDMNNVKIATLTRNAQGNYDSFCTIPCNKTYRVTPYNPKCKFEPSYRDVTLPCCPQTVNLEFRCSCTNSNSSKNNILLFFKNLLVSLLNLIR